MSQCLFTVVSMFGVCVCYRGQMCILKQIKERQEERMQQNTLKEQEGQQLLENLERLQMEELEVWDQSHSNLKHFMMI